MALNIGDIGGLISNLQQAGVFIYVLPFLLVFAVVYAILSRAKFLGDNVGVNVIISLALGLFAIQVPYVTDFFQNLFPNVAIGLSILLALLILGSFFVNFEEAPWAKNLFIGIGVVVAGVIIYNALSTQSYTTTDLIEQYGGTLLVIAAIVALIVFVVIKGKGRTAGAEKK